MSEDKINKPLVYSAIGGFVLVIIWSVYRFYYLPKTLSENSQPEQVACTEDARECPDGSFVGRVPPDCEFEACPDDVATDSAVMQ